jgi:two-component system chemotaxis response regulator CheY
MFSELEATYLHQKINAVINDTQAQVSSGKISGPELEKMEAELAQCISILTRLETDLPKAINIPQIKVLIVEDVESMRIIVQHILAEIGFKHVDAAEDGVKALEMLTGASYNRKPYGLVLSDWQMPKMDGLELLKAVRKNPDISRTPFYLLTSNGEKAYVIEAVKAGASGYMLKPINHNEMLEKISVYLHE